MQLNEVTAKLYIVAVCTCILSASCAQTTPGKQNAQTISSVKDTCDDPDANINCSFINRPADLSNKMVIAGNDEPGDKMIITGTVYKNDGTTPHPDIIMFSYHTDHRGLYSKKGNEKGAQKWHGYLHGWCRTDANGHYEIHTIRPAPYPSNTMPAHIHTAIKTSSGDMYYISDFVFKGDAMVNEKYLSSIRSLPAGTGIVDIKKDAAGIWRGVRDITLK